ncbi:MAG: glycosyltransferase [Chitinophagales bacterium]|nr:glycosyltransferase [Chitinophagales bacterium]
MIEISVVIPSYNQIKSIHRCINSVLNQDIKLEYEIIIVDSSNADIQTKIEQFCMEISDKVRLIKLKTQTFPGSARNIGIKQSRGSIIALIDSDCVASSDWLTNIVANMENNIVLTGVIKNGTPGSVFGTCAYLIEFNNFIAHGFTKREINAAATCNFACFKTVFDEYEYFSNNRAFEDFLFCHNFRTKGGKIYQINHMRITHINKTNISSITKNLKMLGMYSAIVRKKNALPPKPVFDYPALSFLIMPYRYMSIITRLIKTKYILLYFLYSPIILYFLLEWSIGFYKGASTKTQEL